MDMIKQYESDSPASEDENNEQLVCRRSEFNSWSQIARDLGVSRQTIETFSSTFTANLKLLEVTRLALAVMFEVNF